MENNMNKQVIGNKVVSVTTLKSPAKPIIIARIKSPEPTKVLFKIKPPAKIRIK